LLIAAVFMGCSEDLFTGEVAGNKPPVVRLTRVPIERSVTSYKIHFYWDSYDPDGEVDYCEYIIVGGDPYGFSLADTMGKWEKAFVYSSDDSTETVKYNDKIFNFECDSTFAPWEGNTASAEYTRYEKTNTFFIRAIDLDGAVSRVEHVSFTSWTLAPKCEITKPEGSSRGYSVVVTFGWKATDYIDSPDNSQFPESIRYFCETLKEIGNLYPPGDTLPDAYTIADSMNSRPKLYYSLWGDWRKYSSVGYGSGERYGDDPDEDLDPREGAYIFAVQAKDEAGAVTSIMEKDNLSSGNVRLFSVSGGKVPNLTISEGTIGNAMFLGASSMAKEVYLPPGVELNFSWSGDAEEYGGKIVGYRYGWDIVNTENPAEWDVSTFGLDYTHCTKLWSSGTHTLFVEGIDDAQHISRGLVLIHIVKFAMERDLLFVDDWEALGVPTTNGQIPGENDHDNFLINIFNDNLGSAFVNQSFQEGGDVYDCSALGEPSISDISNYKNIVWIYGADSNSPWKKNLEFVAKSEAGSTNIHLNLIKLFLHAGGHVLTYGYSAHAGGGLTDCFDGADYTRNQEGSGDRFPISIEDDLIFNDKDDSYKDCMVYGDYGVKVMNKIDFCDRDEYAENSMVMAILDRNDPVTSMYPGFPDTLKLNSDITTNGMFWDVEAWDSLGADPCGLWYVETFDGPKDMDRALSENASHLNWFHPMYRMRACSSLSDFEDAPVALILTKNAYRVAYSGTGIAANSFHFGFPLWYLEKDSVDKIFEIIFTEWQIYDK
jgi:hypothetical protein